MKKEKEEKGGRGGGGGGGGSRQVIGQPARPHDWEKEGKQNEKK